MRDMYAAQGFKGDLLKRVVETATADKERWLRIMMNEELGLPPEALRWRPGPPSSPWCGAGRRRYSTGALRRPVADPGHGGVRGGYRGRAVRPRRLQGPGRRPARKDGVQFAVIAGLAALAAGAIGALLHASAA
ncbi:MAG: hypothetical protein ACR2MP_31370 [Streptosporangiaceae bacterium]